MTEQTGIYLNSPQERMEMFHANLKMHLDEQLIKQNLHQDRIV